jgi:hypothetical protein
MTIVSSMRAQQASKNAGMRQSMFALSRPRRLSLKMRVLLWLDSRTPTDWLHKLLLSGWLTLALSALLFLILSGCASSSTPSPAPIVIQRSPLPNPPPDLMQPPKSSGAYLDPVTQWRRKAEETLKALPIKSAASSPSS